LSLGSLSLGFNIPRKRLLALVLLFSPSFAWLYMVNIRIYQFAEVVRTYNPQEWDWVFTGKTLFLISIIISAIIGSIISEKVKRKRLLTFWILFGVLTTASFSIFEGLHFFLLNSILIGISFGIGFPSALAFVADSTNMENRARVSGTIFFSAYITLILILAITLQCESNESILLCSAFRGISFFALLIDPIERTQGKEKSWLAVLKTPGFGIYFFSWLLFIAADGISYFVESVIPPPLIPEYESLGSLSLILTYVSVAFTGFISGFISDCYGRKKSIIFGLSTLGISYMVYGIFLTTLSWLATQIIYGAAWGIVFVNYYFTVIGDFSTRGSKERFYAVGGVVPLILTFVFPLFSEMFSISVSITIQQSLLSIFLFIAVIPLFFAPETLHRKIIRQKKFKAHIKNVKKLIADED